MPSSGWTSYIRSAAATAIPFVLALYILVLNMSLGRPIWIDEFLHFAIAAAPSSVDAWYILRNSIAGVNHGQTGIYMMLDHWLISAFGANATALRLPSIISGAFLLASSVWLFRFLHLSLVWQLTALAALFGQAFLMYFAGEARPYMPLAAASVGILAYYVAPLGKRRRWLVSALGLCSVVIGTTMHPYFALYWPVLCLVAYCHHCWSRQMQFGIRSLISHANIALVAAGTILYFLVAQQTWLAGTFRGIPKFSFDPFQFIHNPSPWVHFSDYSHFHFLYPNIVLAAVGTAIAVIALTVVPHRLRGSLTSLGGPVLLLVAAVAVSLLLAWVSYIRDYWIVPRQWVASIALVALAVVWLWGEVARVSSRIAPALGAALWVLPALLIAGQVLRAHNTKLTALSTYVRNVQVPPIDSAYCLTSPGQAPPHGKDVESQNAAWVELANRNIECGGAIWPVFRQFPPYRLAPSGGEPPGQVEALSHGATTK